MQSHRVFLKKPLVWLPGTVTRGHTADLNCGGSRGLQDLSPAILVREDSDTVRNSHSAAASAPHPTGQRPHPARVPAWFLSIRFRNRRRFCCLYSEPFPSRSSRAGQRPVPGVAAGEGGLVAIRPASKRSLSQILLEGQLPRTTSGASCLRLPFLWTPRHRVHPGLSSGDAALRKAGRPAGWRAKPTCDAVVAASANPKAPSTRTPFCVAVSGTFTSTGPRARATCTTAGLSLRAPHAWQGALEPDPFACSTSKQGCPLGRSVTSRVPGPAADGQFQGGHSCGPAASKPRIWGWGEGLWA